MNCDAGMALILELFRRTDDLTRAFTAQDRSRRAVEEATRMVVVARLELNAHLEICERCPKPK